MHQPIQNHIHYDFIDTSNYFFPIIRFHPIRTVLVYHRHTKKPPKKHIPQLKNNNDIRPFRVSSRAIFIPPVPHIDSSIEYIRADTKLQLVQHVDWLNWRVLIEQRALIDLDTSEGKKTIAPGQHYCYFDYILCAVRSVFFWYMEV